MPPLPPRPEEGSRGRPAGSTRKGPPQLPEEQPKNLSKGYVFTQWMNKHPGMKGYSDLIWKWAGQYGVDPTYLAALILAESGGNAAVKNSQGSVGLAQIHMGTWKGQTLPWGETVTEDWAKVPGNAVRFAAWYFAQGVAKTGSYEKAYTEHYNPADPNRFKAWKNIAGTIPTKYVPKGSGLSPAESASVAVETAGEKDALTNVWAVRTKDGVKFVQSAEPPKGTVRAYGQPVDKTGFLRAKQHYNDTYQAYVGKNAPDSAIAHILNTGLSDYALANRLSKSPNFKNGTVYKARAGGIVEYAKGLFGGNWKADQDLVRQAIVQNWDEGTLVSKLKARPEYLKGPEFKKDEAGLLNVHQSIMGSADDTARVTIKEAVLGGWSADQYAAYLRGSKEYTSSPEYQSKALTFLEAMGLITGEQAVLRPGKAPVNPARAEAAPPDSSRIPGKPGLTRPNDLTPGGSLG